MGVGRGNDCPVNCRIFSKISGFQPLDVSIPSNCDNQECFGIAKCAVEGGVGTKSAPFENHGHKGTFTVLDISSKPLAKDYSCKTRLVSHSALEKH